MLDKSNLHAYQRHAVQHIINNKGAGLFLDLGLGKSISTLTALEELIYDRYETDRVLIIAPKRVAESTWVDELETWAHVRKLTASVVLGTEKQRKEALAAKADLYIINRENVAWLVHVGGWNFDCVVIDELSSFKSHQSLRFKSLRKVLPRVDRIIGLTGTPSPNGMLDLWSQVYLLDGGKRLGKFIGAYRNKYFKEGRRNGHIVYDYVLREGAEQEIRDKISDICISMSKEDYLSLPKRIDRIVQVRIDCLDKYKEFEREQVLTLGDGSALTAANAAVVSGKLQQFASGAVYDEDGKVHEFHTAKLEACKELIEASNSPVLIAYAYRHERDRLVKELGARELLGAEDVQAWNRGDVPVLIGHPASMGHGLNLQHGGHTIIWYGLTWSLELYMQLNARLDRQGQTKPVVVHHLVAKGTIDERVLKAIKGKKESQDGLLNAIKAMIIEYGKAS